MQPMPMTPGEFLQILKRRRWSLILPTAIILVSSALVAMSMPSIYKSTATILIEEQEIPADFVTTTVTSYIEQRLQSINRRIMSYSRLLEVIQRFDLYADLINKWSTEEIIEKMRQDTILAPISADVIHRRTGKKTPATIAFSLSYQGTNPRTVQKVTNVLTSLYLSENLKAREKQAQETSEFLEKEMEKLKVDLAGIESKIAAFKEENINELPELLQVNLQSLNNIERSLERIYEQLRSLKERKEYLETQLASLPSHLDPEVDSSRKRLEELKVHLVHLTNRFSEQYPDVIKTRAEIADLEKYLREKRPKSSPTDEPPTNPAYVTLAAHLASTTADLGSVKQQIKELSKSADIYRRRIEATPRVEEVYKTMLIERDNTRAKFDELMRKLMDSRLAYGLEKDQKGEHFTLIEPARLPEKPFKPNRKAIILIGLALGIGAGIALASLREFSDDTIRSSDALTLATGFPVLAGIPEITTPNDVRRRRVRKIALSLLSLGLIAAGLVIVHFHVMDLNIVWAKVMQRLAM